MRSEFSIEAEHLPSISAASTGDGRTVETMVTPVFVTHTAVRGRRDLSSVIYKDWRATSTQSSGWACVVTNDFDSDRTTSRDNCTLDHRHLDHRHLARRHLARRGCITVLLTPRHTANDHGVGRGCLGRPGKARCALELLGALAVVLPSVTPAAPASLPPPAVRRCRVPRCASP
jgi:hypothetical protein